MGSVASTSFDDIPTLGWRGRLWLRVRPVFRRYQGYFVGVPLFVIFTVIVAEIWATERLGDLLFKDAMELTAFWVGLPALLAVLHQTRNDTRWNGVLSYHDYFDELPVQQKLNDLYKVLNVCSVEIPTLLKPLSEEDFQKIDAAAKPGSAETTALEGLRPRGVVRAYLNDFEEFAGAVEQGVVDEDYAYSLEGTRVLVAYFGFRAFIESDRKTDKEEECKMNLKGKDIDFLVPKSYLLLERLAKRWLARRVDSDWRLSQVDRKTLIQNVLG